MVVSGLCVYHREHLFTKICRPKHAQNFWSKGCHFGVAWKKILIECVQARQGKLGLQIWITLQVNYFRLQVNGQIRGICCEWRAKDLEVRLKLAKNLKPLLELPQQLCYLCIDSSHCLVPWHIHFFRQRKWAVSSPESCVSHKDNFNLNARMVS